jgi:hypothetical protein
MNYFTSPNLPSSSSNIIKLRLPNIASRQYHGIRDQQELESLRRTAIEEMNKYSDNLRKSGAVGDSIVRYLAVHDQEHCTLEQDISICVNSFEKGWIGIDN